MLTQQFPANPALNCCLLALANDNAANYLAISSQAGAHILFGQSLATPFGAEDRFRLGFANDKQTGVTPARKIAVLRQQVVAILVQCGQLLNTHRKLSFRAVWCEEEEAYRLTAMGGPMLPPPFRHPRCPRSGSIPGRLR